MSTSRARPATKESATGEPVFTVSTAGSAETRTWRIEDRRTLTWGKVCGELLDPRAAPVGGVKDGLCFSPAVFTGTRRIASEVAGISLLVADIDCGLDAGDIVPLLRASGYTWALASTHSHMKREFTKRFSADAWARLLAKHETPAGVALAWARMEFVPSALAGGVEQASVTPADDGAVVTLKMVLAHPVPRWRVIIPLAAPWLPPGGPGRAASEVWSRGYLLAWAGLGLGGLIDPACVDAPRLYYTGRQPALAGAELAGGLVVGAEFYSSAPGSPLAPFAALVGAPSRMPIEGTVLAMEEAREAYTATVGEAGHAGKRCRLPGGGGKTYVPWRVDRPGVGEIDLELWHRENGTELMLASLIMERASMMPDGRPDSDSGAVHIECPRRDWHVSDAPGGTFVRDGSGWMIKGTPGRYRGWLHCNHAACAWVTQGRWLAALLKCDAVSWDDLDACAARVLEKRGRAALEDLGDGAPPSPGGANRDDPEGDSGAGAAPASAEPAAPRGSGADVGSGVRDGAKSHPGDSADGVRILEAIRLGREAASAAGDEEQAAFAERQFRATERFICEEIGGRFFDLRATGIKAAQALNRSLLLSRLAKIHGFPGGRTQDVLAAWVHWDMIRRQAGLPWCIVDGIAYQPGGGLLVPGETKGWLYNMWRPGPPMWPEPVSDDDPAVADLLALVTNVTGDDRERDGLLWWMGDMLVRAGRARVTWGPLNFGPQGCGKSLLLGVMVSLVGEHNAAVMPFREFVRGSENTALLKQLTGFEEAGQVGRRGFESRVDFYDVLKPYYTAGYLRLNQKFVTGQDVRLYTRLAIGSNDAHALAIPPDDRRIWPMRARGGKLDETLVARIAARLPVPAEAGKWVRWLRDTYPVLAAKHSFSPFRCPTDDVLSEVKAEVIEETLPVAADIAVEVGRALEDQGRTVLAFDEVIRAVWARMRLDPGEKPSFGQVSDGLTVAGWMFARRARMGGRGAPNRQFWVRKAEVGARGLGALSILELSRRFSEETKNAE